MYTLKDPNSQISQIHYTQSLTNLVELYIHNDFPPNADPRGSFYFRTAYRFQTDFSSTGINPQADLLSKFQIQNFIHIDSTVADNYQRIVNSTIAELYSSYNDLKTVKELRDEITGRINASLNKIFPDLTLKSIGDPLSNGSFYFEKGSSENFHFKNLSAGEKSVFDLILDIIVKSTYYQGAIFCIDEPEIHMHTKLQSAVIDELYKLIPDQSQLWIATHSLGMMKKAKELNEVNPGSVAFISFDNIDFDERAEIKPININKTIWQRFVEIALDEFSDLLAPKTIIFCEGDPKGTKNKNFDSEVYSRIFEEAYPDISFVSIGSSNDLEKHDNLGILAVKQVLRNSNTRIITDRDDKSLEEIVENISRGINTLKERHLEVYLLDDEIIKKLCLVNGKSNLIGTALDVKKQAMNSSVSRGYPSDDVKAASGEIYHQLKKLLELKSCGNNSEAFLRDTMAPLVTSDTNVFQRLREEVIGIKGTSPAR